MFRTEVRDQLYLKGTQRHSGKTARSGTILAAEVKRDERKHASTQGKEICWNLVCARVGVMHSKKKKEVLLFTETI